MARDFENVHDLENLSDDELRGVVREHLRAHAGLDADDLTVTIDAGTVVLAGRVGTDGERRIAEHVVTDTLGITSVRNEVLVDPLRRAQSPEAIDEHLAAEERTEGLMLGDRAPQHADEAVPDDLPDARLRGTTDVSDAIAEGVAWYPPESPTPEGIEGRPANPADRTGEDH